MAHRSRLCTLVLDSRVDDLDASTRFWSRALGRPIACPDEDGDGRYARLMMHGEEPGLLLQRVEHDSRVHLDIETDDVEAEVRRLEGLGATRVAHVHQRWWVMQAPSGHRFCVVPTEHELSEDRCNKWD